MKIIKLNKLNILVFLSLDNLIVIRIIRKIDPTKAAKNPFVIILTCVYIIYICMYVGG